MKWQVIIIAFFMTNLANSEILKIGTQFHGLKTDEDPILLKDGETPDSENVQTDIVQGISPRLGFVVFSTESSKKLWDFPHSNGTRYMITQSSNILKAVASGNSNFTILVGTVDNSVETAGASLGDRFYYTNITDGLKYFDGSNVVTTSVTAKGSLLVTHKGRLMLGGVVGDLRTIYGSAYLDGTNFTLAVNPVNTDPFRQPIGGNSNDPLTAFFSSFNDIFIYYTKRSFGGLYGSNRSNFILREYSPTIGTVQQYSIQNCYGKLRWLGSENKLWEFDGSTIKFISQGNDTLLSKLVGTGKTNRSWTQSSASDWGSGTSGINIDTTTTPGSVIFISQSTPALSKNNWTVYTGSCSVTDTYGAIANQVNGFPDCGMNTVMSISIATWTFNLGVSFNQYSQLILDFANSGSGASFTGYRLITSVNGTVLTFETYVAGNTAILISSVVPSNTSSVLVSRDKNGIWNFTDSSGNLLLGTFFNNAYKTFSLLQFDGQRTGPSGGQIISTITVASSIDILNSTFTSQTFNLNETPQSWGAFTANYQLNSGSITHVIFTGTSPSISPWNSGTYISSQVVSNGASITVGTYSYVAVMSSFSRTNSSFTTTMNNFTVPWIATTSLLTPSMFYNLRTYWGVAVSSQVNNKVFVYDRLGDLQRYSGFSALSFLVFNGVPYFGNSGSIYQFDIGNTDNGAAIASYFNTKYYAPGDLDFIDYFGSVYVTCLNSIETLNLSYQVQGVNTNYSIGPYAMNTLGGGYQNSKIPFPSTFLLQGNYIQFKFSVTGTTNWRILNANFHHHSDKVPGQQ